MTFETCVVDSFLKEQMMQDPRAWILELIDSEMTGSGTAQDDRDAARIADAIATYIEKRTKIVAEICIGEVYAADTPSDAADAIRRQFDL
jgi:hypothetical protein